MTITNGSDFILLLDISDIKGQPMRVADCASFQVRLYTDDPRYALVYSKRDILTDGPKDRIPIESKQLEKLESGVLQYEYDYSVYNPDFTGTEVYQKVKNVVTDFYWQNRGNFDNAENVVTWQIIKNLQDAIDACQVECGREMGALKHYIEVEYTNKLTDEIQRLEDKISEEIKRSNEVDIEFHKWLKELEQNLKNSGNDVSDIRKILDDLKSVDEYLQNQINANKEAIDNIEIDNRKAIDDVNYRIDALKANSETIDKELDMRLDATERRLNTLQDSNDNTPGSLANTLKRANQYTDNVFKDSRSGLATEDELARVEAKIPVVPTNISAFVNDMNYITDREIFNNFYKKEEVDEKHKAIADEIEDINTWAVRKDQTTRFVDMEGNVIREIQINPDEPEYYTQIEVDELISNLNGELTGEITKTNERLSRLTVQHDQDIQTVMTEMQTADDELKKDLTNLEDLHNTDIQNLTEELTNLQKKHDDEIASVNQSIENNKSELEEEIENVKSELNGKIEVIDGKVGALDTKIDSLDTKHDEDIVSVNQKITNLETKVDKDIDNLAENYYDSEEIDNMFKDVDDEIDDVKSELQKEISDAKTELKGEINAVDNKVEILESKHDGDIVSVNQSIDEAKSELTGSINSVKSELNEKISEVETELSGKISDLETTVENNKSDIENKLSEAKEELNGNINSVSGKVDTLESKHDGDIISVNQNIANAKSELTETISEVDERVKTLEAIDHTQYATNDALNSVKSDLQKQITDNKSESENALSEAENRLNGAINSTKSELEQNISNVESKVDNLSAKVNTLETTVEDNKTDIEGKLSKAKDEINKSIADAKEELKSEIDNIDLSDYYRKEETYSSQEIDEKLKSVDVTDQLNGYVKVWKGTYDAYQKLGTYDDQTLYCVKG